TDPAHPMAPTPRPAPARRWATVRKAGDPAAEHAAARPGKHDAPRLRHLDFPHAPPPPATWRTPAAHRPPCADRSAGASTVPTPPAPVPATSATGSIRTARCAHRHA